MQDEFVVKDADATMTTMADDPVVNHVPVLTGGVGPDEVRAFYAESFIPQMPPDFTVTPVSRTIGHERVVDEMEIRFTPTVPMAWMLPGLAPTGRRVEAAFVVVTVSDGKVAAEHIYWDQASVLVQLGLIDPAILPVMGAESARTLLDPPSPPMPSSPALAWRTTDPPDTRLRHIPAEAARGADLREIDAPSARRSGRRWRRLGQVRWLDAPQVR